MKEPILVQVICSVLSCQTVVATLPIEVAYPMAETSPGALCPLHKMLRDE